MSGHASSGRQRFSRMLRIALFLVSSLLPVQLVAGPPPERAVAEARYTAKQGQIIVVKIPVDNPTAVVQGTFLGRTIPFFFDPRPTEPPGFVALLGLDLQDEPGIHPLTIGVTDLGQGRRLTYDVLVIKEQFRVEHLTLPKDKVDLDAKNLARWKDEQDRVREALATDSPSRLWEPGFLEPVVGRRTGIFGSVRIMNGQARNPHNGEDIGAPVGTDVSATNAGIVRLVVDHVFSGKGLYVDHGLGFYSMYFHLSEVLVKEGQTVKAGQVVGRVGATGRATGPHLHWGVRINGARVNPYALLDLPFRHAGPGAPTIPVSTPAD